MKPSTVAVISDIHANSTLGLCPPTVNLDDGGTYRANKPQQWLWQQYLKYTNEVAKTHKANKGKLYLVLNGDIVDGDHHNSSQIISRNMATQAKIALAALKPLLDLQPDYIFVVRGTPAHVGEAGMWEEWLANDLGAEPCPTTKSASWNHLKLDVNGVQFDVAHHGKLGNEEWTRHNSANKLAYKIVAGYIKSGQKPPHLAFRGHKHFPSDTGNNYDTRLIHTPAWQFPTSFVYKISGAIEGQIVTGGAIVTCNSGNYNLQLLKYTPRPDPFWKASNK